MGRFATTTMAALLLIGGAGPALGDSQVSCGKIIAAMDEQGDAKSADEMATQLGTTVERIRECMKTPAANPPGNPPSPGARPETD